MKNKPARKSISKMNNFCFIFHHQLFLGSTLPDKQVLLTKSIQENTAITKDKKITVKTSSCFMLTIN
jgi:hypothetical protein